MSQNDLYRPLLPGEYRLLRIVHDSQNDLKCRMQNYRLDNHPEYSAVSYTWGGAEDPVYSAPFHRRAPESFYTIKVNECNMEVTENLFDMLHQFRTSHPEDIDYWIDAICINQKDIEEKTKQVNQMAEIYSGAGNVVVWLGKSDDGTHEVLKLIQQLSAAFRKEHDMNSSISRFAGLNDPLDIEQMKQLGIDEVTIAKWLNLMCFYQRRWFYRVWTIQEVALAKEIIVICGQYVVAWNWITDAARLLTGTPLYDALRELVLSNFKTKIQGLNAISFQYYINLARGIRSTPNFDRNSSLWGTGSSVYSSNVAVLDRLLFGLQGFLATDPRDYVFGILGLASKAAHECTKEPLPLLADYTKETSKLYTEVMAYMIHETGMLTLLGRVQPPTYRQTPGLPSWVIDFSANGPDGILQVSKNDATTRMDRMYNASRASTVGFRIEGARLVCHSFMYSRVKLIGDSGDDLVAGNGFEQTAAVVIASLEYHNAVAAQIELLYKSIICDMNCKYGLEVSDEQLRSSFSGMMLAVAIQQVIHGLRRGEKRSKIIETMTSQDHLSKLDGTGIIPSSQTVENACQRMGVLENGIDSIDIAERNRILKDQELYHSFLMTYMSSRRTFLAEDGSIGLGSIDVQPGDEVHIIADGVRTPLVLRQPSSGQESERLLIGEAFVRGLMYGEAIETMNNAGYDWKQLSIV
ncbi:MAG: hypothetical protein M1820_005794 [Bogoriella megaspora]|nr:MAG: hypothetical protein M1820_005794 [Bogoriella megaspora]